MNKLKVLYIAPEYPNQSQSAAQVRSNELLPRLDKKLGLHILGYPATSNEIDSRNHGDLLTRATLRKSGLGHTLATFHRLPRALYRFGGANNTDLVAKCIKRLNPDVVHLDSFGAMTHLPFLEREYSGCVVMQPHDSLTRIYDHQWRAAKNVSHKLDRYLQWRKFRKFEVCKYSTADLILVDTEKDAVFLRTLDCNTNVKVLPLGFSPKQYSPEGPRADIETKSLVFSGSMGSVQSVAAAEELVNSIMPNIWKQHPDCHLYFVGSNPTSHVKSLAAQDQRVHVTGFVDDLASYLRASTVFVCPLRLGSGMRTRTVEALACGCAVVTFPDGVEGLEGGDDGPWKIASTADDFSWQVSDLLDSPEAVQKLRRQSVEFVSKKFTWDAVANRLFEMYSNLCDQN